jgi:membrane-bound serine protease (ClpP class)
VVKNKNTKIEIKNPQVNYINLTSRQNFLASITNPNIAYLLFTMGFLALLFEITHPGFGVAGISGIIMLLLAFYAFEVLSVSYAGLALVAIGIVFFIAEAFTPSFGLFTAAGAISLGLGSLMLFKNHIFLALSKEIVFTFMAMAILWANIILAKLIKVRRQKPLTGKEHLIGKQATALTKIDKKGKVEIEGEIWNATSKQKIKQGEKVVIKKVSGLNLIVESLKKEAE